MKVRHITLANGDALVALDATIILTADVGAGDLAGPVRTVAERLAAALGLSVVEARVETPTDEEWTFVDVLLPFVRS